MRSRPLPVLVLVCALDTGIAAAQGTPRAQFTAWAIGLPDSGRARNGTERP